MFSMNGVSSLQPSPLEGVRQALNGQKNLSGMELMALNLSGLDFTGANAKSANFTGADVSGATLAFESLEGARFNVRGLAAATLVHIQGAVLDGLDLADVDLPKMKPGVINTRALCSTRSVSSSASA